MSSASIAAATLQATIPQQLQTPVRHGKHGHGFTSMSDIDSNQTNIAPSGGLTGSVGTQVNKLV